ncbi:MAG TPA: flagellar hook-basal body complex protein FliE [Pseudolabrys sp.]|jgi:flagellar hook-basal body complex protein FliE|nr:flagellar hook-basal body complex protein FliE [Pseudolabrys sp.]
MPTPLAAAGAYASAARLAADPALALAGKTAAAGAGDTSFATVLKDAMGSLSAAGRKTDAQAREMVAGKGNMVNVVTAVAETEVAIDAVVAVRDRVIQAYEDIMKMPI